MAVGVCAAGQSCSVRKILADSKVVEVKSFVLRIVIALRDVYEDHLILRDLVIIGTWKKLI